ncbi:MAG: WYL domain-containing protein [Selenomonadaceae bacterium]|nr:WYL domain-containing protein [Selenomonadaceae bacterium]
MKSLFNEINNPLFHELCRLVNEIHSGHKLTRKELRQRITNISVFHYNEAPETDREDALIDKLFHFATPSSPAEICLDAPLPALVTRVELSWLKNMLLDESFAFLLPANIREKLLNRLQDISPLHSPDLLEKNSKPSHSPCLSILLDALYQKKMIHCPLGLIAPCRLEYDLATKDYALIAWNPATREVIKSSLDDLHLIEASEQDLPSNTFEELSSYLQSHQKEVTLQLTPTRNTFERCFSLFSTYDKNARMEQDNTYLLTIRYYDLNHEEIVQKIRSLGTAVTILAPEDMRQSMQDTLRQMEKLYLS